MAMELFVRRCRELAERETRTMTFCGHPSGIPDGEYALLEWYCNERGCDCRRVLIHFVTKPPNVKTWASTNFGWEDPEFYRRWKASEHAVGVFLDAPAPPLRGFQAEN